MLIVKLSDGRYLNLDHMQTFTEYSEEFRQGAGYYSGHYCTVWTVRDQHIVISTQQDCEMIKRRLDMHVEAGRMRDQ